MWIALAACCFPLKPALDPTCPLPHSAMSHMCCPLAFRRAQPCYFSPSTRWPSPLPWLCAHPFLFLSLEASFCSNSRRASYFFHLCVELLQTLTASKPQQFAQIGTMLPPAALPAVGRPCASPPGSAASSRGCASVAPRVLLSRTCSTVLVQGKRGANLRRFAPSAKRGSSEDEADWEAEMSIFKQRISRPNQLATLRELEAKVNVGKVRKIPLGASEPGPVRKSWFLLLAATMVPRQRKKNGHGDSPQSEDCDRSCHSRCLSHPRVAASLRKAVLVCLMHLSCAFCSHKCMHTCIIACVHACTSCDDGACTLRARLPGLLVRPGCAPPSTLAAAAIILQVLFVHEGLAIVSGLNPDAPLGTKLTFVTGAIG